MLIKNKTTALITLPDSHILPSKATYEVKSNEILKEWIAKDRSFARHINEKTIVLLDEPVRMAPKKEKDNVKHQVES